MTDSFSVFARLLWVLSVSRGSRYPLTIVDRFTHYPDAISIANAETQNCNNCIHEKTNSFYTDRGEQLDSLLFRHTPSVFGILSVP